MRKVLYVFGILTDADVAWMARRGVRRRVARDEIVIVEGAIIDFLAIVLDGELLVATKRAGLVARLGVGEVIGEISLVESASTSATIQAGRDSLILAIDKAVLLDKLGADDGFASRFYRALAVFLADRLRAATTERAARMGHPVDEQAQDELDIVALDTISAAGERFQRMLEMLRTARP